MYKWIIILLISGLNFVNAQNVAELNKKYQYNKGVQNPVELLANALAPLKKGISGLQETEKVVTGNSITSNKYNNYTNEQMIKQGTNPLLVQDNSVFNNLALAMSDNAVLKKVQLVSKDDSKLNGHVQTYIYTLHFSNGKSSTVQFSLLKSSISGGYLITKMTSVD